MANSAAVLTWNFTERTYAPNIVASGSNGVAQDFAEHIDAHSLYWEVEAGPIGTLATGRYWILRPKAAGASARKDIRILLGSSDTVVPSAVFDNMGAVVNQCYMLMAPMGGAATFAANAFTAAAGSILTGGTALENRHTYWGKFLSPYGAGDGSEHVAILETEETLDLRYHAMHGDNVHSVSAGAIFACASDDAGEAGEEGRIYGAHWGVHAPGNANFMRSGDPSMEWLGVGPASNTTQPRLCGFAAVRPTVPVPARADVSPQLGDEANDVDQWKGPRGDLPVVPIGYRMRDAPNIYLGHLRQRGGISFATDLFEGDIIYENGSPIGYAATHKMRSQSDGHACLNRKFSSY